MQVLSSLVISFQTTPRKPEQPPLHNASQGRVFAQPHSNLGFGGVSDVFYRGSRAMVNSIQWVDQTPIRGLLLAGVLGMTTPRVILEWVNRGKDMVLETLFREITGDISMVFLSGLMGSAIAGLASHGVLKRIINKPYPEVNMHWRNNQVNANSMNTLGNLFIEKLENGTDSNKTLHNVKTEFVEEFFERLRYAKRDYSHPVLDSLEKTLKANNSSISLGHMIANQEEGKLVSSLGNQLTQKILDLKPDNTLTPKQARAKFEQGLEYILKSFLSAEELREHNAKVIQAAVVKQKNNPQQLKAIIGHFVDESRIGAIQTVLEKQANRNILQRISDTLAGRDKLIDVIKDLFSDEALSKIDIEPVEKLGRSIKLPRIEVDMLDHLNGATNEWVLSHDKVSLKVLLQEKLTLLNDFLDPVFKETFELTGDSKISKDLFSQVKEYLTGPADKALSGLKRLIPKKSSGLFNYMMSAKYWLTFIPITIALGITMAEAFINNWLTKKRHGGKVFSPFLGGPIEYGTMNTVLNAAIFRKPLQHSTPNLIFNEFMHPRRSMWMQTGQGAPHGVIRQYEGNHQ